MCEVARETDPATQPRKQPDKSGKTGSLSAGKHCPLDSALPRPAPAAKAGRDKRKGQPFIRLSANRLRTINDGLGPLDRDVLRFLSRFTVATTDQLTRLFYADRTSRHASDLACWRILHRLHGSNLIARLPRRVGGLTGGSAPGLWYLASAGTRLVLQSGKPEKQTTRVRANEPPAVTTLNHRLMVTETYVRLSLLKQSGLLDILDFASEPACWRRFAGMGGVTVLKPDAWAHTAAHGSKYEWYWFLEADLGTESRAAISRKADVYEAYRRTRLEQDRQHVFPKVVWLTPDQARTDRLDTLFAAEHLAAGHQAMTLDRFVGLVANHQPGDA